MRAGTRLAALPTTPRIARAFVVDTLARWQRPCPVEVITLLTSEVVTNAVRHTTSDIDLGIRTTRTSVRVEVEDGSRSVPVRCDVEPLADAGRGLVIVGELARQWGVEPTPRGKKVWFEVPTAACEPRRQRDFWWWSGSPGADLGGDW